MKVLLSVIVFVMFMFFSLYGGTNNVCANETPRTHNPTPVIAPAVDPMRETVWRDFEFKNWQIKVALPKTLAPRAKVSFNPQTNLHRLLPGLLGYVDNHKYPMFFEVEIGSCENLEKNILNVIRKLPLSAITKYDLDTIDGLSAKVYQENSEYQREANISVDLISSFLILVNGGDGTCLKLFLSPMEREKRFISFSENIGHMRDIVLSIHKINNQY
ncbi:MAG: hypothetical protein HQK51_10175 [Oligoflexia bacterium]|nr:hypothetical protein [Oligoflexia bacterium]